MCRYRYFLRNVSVYQYNINTFEKYLIPIYLKIKNPKKSFITFLCDNLFKHQAVNNFAAIYNDFRASFWPYMQTFYILTTISIGPEFGQKLVRNYIKKYQKMYQRAKMYLYIDTFCIYIHLHSILHLYSFALIFLYTYIP